MPGSDTPASRDITYEQEMGTYHAQFDWTSDESLRIAVAETVAAVADVSPTDLESLYGSVNPGALDELFVSESGDELRQDGGVWFTLDDFTVTVHSDGEIVVSPQTEANTDTTRSDS